MPGENLNGQFASAQRKRALRAAKLGLPVPSPEWGDFNKLRACHAIRRELRSHAQHVALILALMTPEDGVIEITHKDLHEITGRANETVVAALKELESAGFVFGRRTIGTFVYTWGEKAYLAAKPARMSG